MGAVHRRLCRPTRRRSRTGRADREPAQPGRLPLKQRVDVPAVDVGCRVLVERAVGVEDLDRMDKVVARLELVIDAPALEVRLDLRERRRERSADIRSADPDRLARILFPGRIVGRRRIVGLTAVSTCVRDGRGARVRRALLRRILGPQIPVQHALTAAPAQGRRAGGPPSGHGHTQAFLHLLAAGAVLCAPDAAAVSTASRQRARRAVPA